MKDYPGNNIVAFNASRYRTSKLEDAVVEKRRYYLKAWPDPYSPMKSKIHLVEKKVIGNTRSVVHCDNVSTGSIDDCIHEYLTNSGRHKVVNCSVDSHGICIFSELTLKVPTQDHFTCVYYFTQETSGNLACYQLFQMPIVLGKLACMVPHLSENETPLALVYVTRSSLRIEEICE